MQVAQRRLTMQLFQLEFFQVEFVNADFAFRIHKPQQIACDRRLGRTSAKHGGQKACEPAWPCARARPPIEIRRAKAIRMQLKSPARLHASGFRIFRNLSVPRAAESIDTPE